MARTRKTTTGTSCPLLVIETWFQIGLGLYKFANLVQCS